MADALINPVVPGDVCELAVDALVSDGRGLGRFRGMAVFVDGALPGQTVRTRIAAVDRKSVV